jgi:hypothetical protein
MGLEPATFCMASSSTSRVRATLLPTNRANRALPARPRYSPGFAAFLPDSVSQLSPGRRRRLRVSDPQVDLAPQLGGSRSGELQHLGAELDIKKRWESSLERLRATAEGGR